MGNGLSASTREEINEKIRNYDILQQLKQHTNFKMPVPDPKKEGLINYTCRCIAELISPTQEDGEDYHVECVDLAKAVKEFSHEIQNAWVEGCAIDPRTK